jgi:hypothetical protein
MKGYESKATITTIKANSKVTLKIRDNFFSVEYSEERTIPDVDGVDIEAERKCLFDDVNAIVDEQANEIRQTFK